MRHVFDAFSLTIALHFQGEETSGKILAGIAIVNRFGETGENLLHNVTTHTYFHIY